MGQWGLPIKIGKAKFLTHVDTGGQCFNPTSTPGSVIDTVMILDDGGDPAAADATLTKLKARLLGASYQVLPAILRSIEK